jgi:hypothetical protein
MGKAFIKRFRITACFVALAAVYPLGSLSAQLSPARQPLGIYAIPDIDGCVNNMTLNGDGSMITAA